MPLRRRSFLAALSAAAFAPRRPWRTSVPSRGGRAGGPRRALARWNGYKRVAWGRDEVRPVSGTAHDFFIPGHSFGLSIIEASNAVRDGLDDDLGRATKWIVDNLGFDVDGEVQMFETNIRMVGGLLAGYYATGEKRLLDLAHVSG